MLSVREPNTDVISVDCSCERSNTVTGIDIEEGWESDDLESVSNVLYVFFSRCDSFGFVEEFGSSVEGKDKRSVFGFEGGFESYFIVGSSVLDIELVVSVVVVSRSNNGIRSEEGVFPGIELC